MSWLNDVGKETDQEREYRIQMESKLENAHRILQTFEPKIKTLLTDLGDFIFGKNFFGTPKYNITRQIEESLLKGVPYFHFGWYLADKNLPSYKIDWTYLGSIICVEIRHFKNEPNFSVTFGKGSLKDKKVHLINSLHSKEVPCTEDALIEALKEIANKAIRDL